MRTGRTGHGSGPGSGHGSGPGSGRGSAHGRGYGRPRRNPVRGVRTVAGQVFVLQVGVVLLLVVAAVVALVLQSRYDSEREARNRSMAVAESFASAPGMVSAIRGPDPSAVLQPLAERARKGSRVDFVVVMTPQGIRFTHPNPDRIGKHFMGSIRPAAEGRTVQETFTGTLGLSVRSVVPVKDSHGKVVGLVAAGITIKKVSGAADHQMPLLFGAAAAAMALATAGTALVSRRLRRQTHGLDPAEMTRMYEHHDAVLHSVREGVLIVGGDRRLVLANDEARRLFDLPPDAEGRLVSELGFDPHTAALLVSGRPATDEVHTAGERLLSVSHRPTDRDGGPPGSVATLRDTTELRALSGKVDLARNRLKLLYDAGVSIGTTLDVVRTAQELAEYAVARFADYVSVDLADSSSSGAAGVLTESRSSCATSTTCRSSLRLPVVLLAVDRVGQHHQAERAGGGDDVRVEGQGLVHALVVDALADPLLHPHPGAARATAEAALLVAVHLLVPQPRHLGDDLARRGVDLVVAAQVAGVVVGDQTLDPG
ncbi:hypothetical protein SANTM175S_01822 [Streptomyces antimycoticus]